MQPIMSSELRSGGVAVAEPARGMTVAPKAWGWPIKMAGSSVLLETTSGFCGLEMRQRLGEAVLRLLCQAGSEGPVIKVMRPNPWFVFLAEADQVIEADSLRNTATLIQRGETIPLPPTNTGLARASWVVAPRADHRWLPALSTIMWALKTATTNGVY